MCINGNLCYFFLDWVIILTIHNRQLIKIAGIVHALINNFSTLVNVPPISSCVHRRILFTMRQVFLIKRLPNTNVLNNGLVCLCSYSFEQRAINMREWVRIVTLFCKIEEREPLTWGDIFKTQEVLRKINLEIWKLRIWNPISSKLSHLYIYVPLECFWVPLVSL